MVQTQQFLQRKNLKNKVIAFDNELQTTVMIDKDQFDGVRYVGVSKDRTTVFNKQTQSYECITREQFEQNRDLYSGPCTNKVNVLDKSTGVRKQIPKSEFDKSIYVCLSSSKQYFKCIDKLTGKQKNVSIYEWRFVRDRYEIIDIDKFNKLLELLHDS